MTTFRWSKEEVLEAIGSNNAEQAIEEGMTLYASAIMQVVTGPRENPTVLSGPYSVMRDGGGKRGIVDAQPWAQPGDLRQYFDVQIVFHGDPEGYPVNMILKLDTGNVIDNKLIGNYDAGHPITKSFPETLAAYGKPEYKIFKSWLSPVIRPGQQLYIQEGTANVIQRNFKVAVGGTNMVAMYQKDPGGNIPSCDTDPTLPECQTITVGCTPPVKGTVVHSPASAMEPKTSAVIKADNRGSEKFDVAKGIPTSETLYGNVNALNYLFKNEFANYTGTCTYKVTVNKTYVKVKNIPAVPSTGPGDPGTPARTERTPVPVSKDVEVKRNYSFWQIGNLEVYRIKEAKLSNYALPNGTITLTPNGYTPPSVTVSTSTNLDDHIMAPALPAINLGSQDVGETVPDETGLFKSEADARIGQIKVRNDSLVFANTQVMDNTYYEQTAPTPGTIPAATAIGNNVLYKANNMISNTLQNKADTPSTGKINYDVINPGNVNGGAPKEFNITGINTVTVHTPVVIYASTSDDRAHNQKTIPATNRNSTILNRPFTVTMPTNGQHRNILGYGNRDYAKYVRDKQVYFPFDVYSGDKSKFYPKGTWISIPVNQETQTFFLPVWVDEGYYDVLFRTIAENTPSNFTTESEANLNLANHVATDTVPIDVVGRVYDFHITDIADFNWETFFRKAKGSSVPTGNSFWVGSNGIDGAPRTGANNYTLPVRQGSNPIKGMQNIAVKTGYTFKFDLKTSGNMFNDQDGVRIIPEFYYVSKDGKNRTLVDLYYHSDQKLFIPVGSSADVEKRNVTLNSRLRNVPQQDIVNTSSSLWEMFAISRGWSTPKQQYMQNYLKKTAQKTYVGGYDVQILTSPLRTFIGNMYGLPNGVDIYRANASVQQWYGEYSLPAAVYAVPRGTVLAQYGKRLDEKSKVFLKGGYIIVNFTIDTIRNGDTSKPHLQYIRRPGSSYYGTYNNQWRDMEGFKTSFTTPYGVKFSSVDGDVMYYMTDRSSYDDFGSSGTH